MNRFNTLEDYIHDCWHLLFRATVRKKEPFRTPVIGTSRGNRPNLRTVVLRAVDIQERQLSFYTDYRSAKVEEIRLQPETTWLFYDVRRKLQLRVRSLCALHYGDETAQQHWKEIGTIGRRSYATDQPPGSPAHDSTDGLPPAWSDDWTAEQTDFAFRNFLLVQCRVFQVECLHLHREGHQRAAFDWKDDNGWAGQWLVP